MEGTRLSRLAAITALAGIAILAAVFWIGENPEPEWNAQAGPPEIGSRMTVRGTVVFVEDHPKVHFLKLSPASPFPIVSFKPFSVRAKDTVKVMGTVKEYKGDLEIIVEKVTIITAEDEKGG